MCAGHVYCASRAYTTAERSASTHAESLQKRISALQKTVEDQEMLRDALRAAQKEIRDLKDSARMVSSGHRPEDSWAPRQHGQLILGEVAGTCRFFGNASPAYLLVCQHQAYTASAALTFFSV